MSEYQSQNKKSGRRRGWILAVVIVALVAVITVWLVTRGKNAAESSYQEFTVNNGAITTTVVGTGNLEEPEAEEAQVRSGLEIREVLVQSGDTVSQGDKLAELDPLSIRREIERILTDIRTLDGQLSVQDESGEETITAACSGRVKAVWAAEGELVSDVMDRQGALAVLSTDGFMCVRIPMGTLSPTDEVVIRREDNTELDGTVDAIFGETAVILFSDDGPIPGEPVTVLDESDNVLGEGSAEIHHPVTVMGFGGSISQVEVEVDDSVRSGAALFRVFRDDSPMDYLELTRQREDLTERLQELSELYREPYILAPVSGIVREVRVADGDTTGSASVAGAQEAGTDAGSMYDASAYSGYSGMTQTGTAGYASGNLAAFGGGTSSSSEPSAMTSQSAERVTAMTVAPSDVMRLQISVDELDVLSVREGQPVEVTVDAAGLSGYIGKITEVSDTGVVVGGIAKYSATVELPRDERLLPGMSATATVTTETREDILVIPADAVQEYGTYLYVYTAVNSETGDLTGERQVEIGLSDGENTEIISGLAAGDVLYYRDAGYSDLISQWMSNMEHRGDRTE